MNAEIRNHQLEVPWRALGRATLAAVEYMDSETFKELDVADIAAPVVAADLRRLAEVARKYAEAIVAVGADVTGDPASRAAGVHDVRQLLLQRADELDAGE